MPDLAEFLLERIAEDEAVARAARISNGEWVRTGEWAGPTEIKEWINPVTSGNGSLAYDQQEHIARHDPARVLAECAAKRAVVDEWRTHDQRVRDALALVLNPAHADQRRAATWFVLRHLAAVYADHEDYDPEWSL